MCGTLQYSLYGARDAAQNWAEEYSSSLINGGFIRGITNPCLFRHRSKTISLLVHGDDFVGVGCDTDIAIVRTLLEKTYKLKSEILGTGRDDKK